MKKITICFIAVILLFSFTFSTYAIDIEQNTDDNYLLQKTGINPPQDIKLDETNGIWTWVGDKDSSYYNVMLIDSDYNKIYTWYNVLNTNVDASTYMNVDCEYLLLIASVDENNQTTSSSFSEFYKYIGNKDYTEAKNTCIVKVNNKTYNVPINSKIRYTYYLNVNEATKDIKYKNKSTKGYISNIDAILSYDKNMLQLINYDETNNFPKLSSVNLLANENSSSGIKFVSSTINSNLLFNNNESILVTSEFEVINSGETIIRTIINTLSALDLKLTLIVDNQITQRNFYSNDTLEILDSIIIGDANKDNSVTISDVTCIQQYLAHVIDDSKINLKAATMMGAQLSISDATHIQQYLARLIDEL